MLPLVCAPQFPRLIFFVASDGRHLSNSSIKEVSEVNVKFEATLLKQSKGNNDKIM